MKPAAAAIAVSLAVLTPSLAAASGDGIYNFRYKFAPAAAGPGGGTTPPPSFDCPAPSGRYADSGRSLTAQGCRYESPRVRIGETAWYPAGHDFPSMNAWCSAAFSGSSHVANTVGASARVAYRNLDWLATENPQASAASVTCAFPEESDDPARPGEPLVPEPCDHGYDPSTGECWVPEAVTYDCEALDSMKPIAGFNWTVTANPDGHGCRFRWPNYAPITSESLPTHLVTQEKFCQAVMEPYGSGRAYETVDGFATGWRAFYSSVHDRFDWTPARANFTHYISCTTTPSPCQEGQVQRNGQCVDVPLDCWGFMDGWGDLAFRSGPDVVDEDTCRFTFPAMTALSNESVAGDHRTQEEFCRIAMEPLGQGRSVASDVWNVNQLRAYFSGRRGEFVMSNVGVPYTRTVDCTRTPSPCGAGQVERGGQCLTLPSETCFSVRRENPGYAGSMNVSGAMYDTCTFTWPTITPAAGGNNIAVAYDIHTAYQFCNTALGSGTDFTIVDPGFDVLMQVVNDPRIRNWIPWGGSGPALTPYPVLAIQSLQCRTRNTAGASAVPEGAGEAFWEQYRQWTSP